MSYNPYRKYCASWWKFWLNVPSDIMAFIKRLWDYAPLLWEDRDWDQAYLLRMMRFKIHRMRAGMERHSVMAHAEDIIAEMAQADVFLRNAIYEDPDDEWSLHYSQWDSHLQLAKRCKSQKEHMRSLDLSRIREERNWHALWKHLNKYLRGWGD